MKHYYCQLSICPPPVILFRKSTNLFFSREISKKQFKNCYLLIINCLNSALTGQNLEKMETWRKYRYLHSSSDCRVFESYINRSVLGHLRDCKGQLLATPLITMYLSALWISAIKNSTFLTFKQWFSCNQK